MTTVWILNEVLKLFHYVRRLLTKLENDSRKHDIGTL